VSGEVEMHQSIKSGKWIIFQDTETNECYTFDTSEIISVSPTTEFITGEKAVVVGAKNATTVIMKGWTSSEVSALLTGAVTEKRQPHE